jgi:hypothetical protein
MLLITIGTLFVSMAIIVKIAEMKAKDFLERHLSHSGEYTMRFHRHEEYGDYVIDIYDQNDEFYASVQGPTFGNVLRHALHYIDPLLASAAFPDDWLEFSEKHRIMYEE